jgi:D-xylose transport system substrate-binding protein
MTILGKRAVVAAALLSGALVFAGCSSGNENKGSTGNESVEKGFKIGILLPESKTTRYETFDKPYMEAKIKALCAKCEVLYQNADQDSAKQLSQAEAMLTQGVKVLILDPVDAKAAGGIVTNAQTQKIPVVAYDRLAQGPVTYYVSFDNNKVGQVQGQALLTTLGGDPKRGGVVMINGSPTDPNAADFKAGAHSVLNGKVNIAQEYDTPDWSPDKAQQEMEQAITVVGKDKIIGVYAANDGTAGGAIAAMKGGGFSTVPPTTGQDAELAAIQRILIGDQYMTVYKAIKPEAETAAEMAVVAATGKQYSGQDTVQKNNGTKDVTSVLLTPVAVMKNNIKDTVIKDGFYSPAQVCAAQYAQACKDAGIL